MGNTYFKHKYVQDLRVVRGMGRGISDLCVVLCKFMLGGAWKVVVRARRIISEKLREYQYRERYARSLEGKKVEWDGDDNMIMSSICGRR